MLNRRLLAGIIVFGSLWGFSEVIIGSALSDAGLPSGALMTGFFALIFLVSSRMIYQQPGMQFGMSLVAGSLRWFNPFVGCHICSAMAIMAEGLIFELIWYKLSDIEELQTLTAKSSLGIVTSYSLYVGGYIITQILTPLSAGLFHVENLLMLLPQIFSRGLLAALIGGAILPVTLSLYKLDFSLKDRLYYPTTLGISVMCWCIILINWYIGLG